MAQHIGKQVMSSTESPVVSMLPFCHVIKVGGRSIVDNGKKATYPLVEAIAAALTKFKLVIGTGGGARAAHVTAVGMDLGLPTGALAQLRIFDALGNAHMLGTLLAPHGVVAIPPEILGHMLPFFIKSAPGVICNGDPPFSLWEHPPRMGRIPPHRTDAGTYLLAECYGCATHTLIKDVDGLYDADPKTHPSARFIKDITVAEGAQSADVAVRSGTARSAGFRPAGQAHPDHQRYEASFAGAGSEGRARRDDHPQGRLRLTSAAALLGQGQPGVRMQETFELHPSRGHGPRSAVLQVERAPVEPTPKGRLH